MEVETTRRLVVYPPIHRLGTAGRWVRSRLQLEILRGTKVLVRIQGLRSPWRNRVMKASSFLGEEEFYILLVGLLVWLVDVRLGRLMVPLMAVCFYIAGFLKNFLCLPRPPSPPVIPLQQCQDWSLPSHHAVLNVNIPWFIWFYFDITYSVPYPIRIIVFIAISIWSFSVMFSRIYLGVHSPADILTGGVIGCFVLAIWLQCYETIDSYLTNSPSLYTVIGTICVIVLLLSIHPDPHPNTIVFPETVCMTGVAVGFIIGQVSFTPPTGSCLSEAVDSYANVWSISFCAFLRYILGLVVLVTARAVSQIIAKTMLKMLGMVAGVMTVCIKRKSDVTGERVHYSSMFIVLHDSKSGMEWNQETWNSDKPLNIDIPVKFISYITMGTVAIAICPIVFSLLNI